MLSLPERDGAASVARLKNVSHVREIMWSTYTLAGLWAVFADLIIEAIEITYAGSIASAYLHGTVKPMQRRRPVAFRNCLVADIAHLIKAATTACRCFGTGTIIQLCQKELEEDYVSAVSWMTAGNVLAVGDSQGQVQLWDVASSKLMRSMDGHGDRSVVVSVF